MLALRLARELELLAREPPPGVSVWPRSDDCVTELEASIEGPGDTPYEGGVFKLSISVPERYPFEPPSVRFATPIYHPNIDNGGRICLDTLNMPPKGAWTPSLNLATVLTTIRALMAQPNPDDGLVLEVTQEYRANRPAFLDKARRLTLQHACSTALPAAAREDSIMQLTGDMRATQHSASRVAAASLAAASVPLEATGVRDVQPAEIALGHVRTLAPPVPAATGSAGAAKRSGASFTLNDDDDDDDDDGGGGGGASSAKRAAAARVAVGTPQ